MRQLLGYACSNVRKDVDPSAVSPANEGRLVHVAGCTATTEELVDEDFGVRVRGCVSLRRVVEMYQWVEQGQGTLGVPTQAVGGPATGVAYSKEWRADSVPNLRIQHLGLVNPPFPLQSRTFYASRVTLGAFELPRQLLRAVDRYEACLPASAVRVDVRGAGAREFRPFGMHLTTAQGAPAVGDLRASFAKAPCGDVTVVALQRGGALAALGRDPPGPRESLAPVAPAWLPGPPLRLVSRFAPAEAPEDDLEAANAASSGGGCCLPCVAVASAIEARAEVFRLVDGRVTAAEVLDAVVSGERVQVWVLRALAWLILCWAGDGPQVLLCPGGERGTDARHSRAAALLAQVAAGSVLAAATAAAARLSCKPVRVLSLMAAAASLAGTLVLASGRSSPEFGTTLRTGGGPSGP